MARRALLCFVLGTSVVGLWAGSAPAGTSGWRLVSDGQPKTSTRSPSRVGSALEQDVLANVNQLRRQHGLGPLRLSSKLNSAARAHSSEMARRGYFSHDSANGSSFDKRIAKFYSLGG
jgi:uncharacterized protein YkwD